MSEEKTTGVSFQCTEKQRNNYIKAAGGKKLGAWIQSILDAAVKQQATGGKSKAKPAITTKITIKPSMNGDEDDYDSRGNK